MKKHWVLAQGSSNTKCATVSSVDTRRVYAWPASLPCFDLPKTFVVTHPDVPGTRMVILENQTIALVLNPPPYNLPLMRVTRPDTHYA